MALTDSPYSALAKLLGASSEYNADDPHGLLQGRLALENQTDEDIRRAENSASNPTRSFSGATPSSLAKEKSDLAEAPIFGDAAKAQSDLVNKMNNAALAAGYVGDTDIAGPASGEPGREQLYANVGNRSPLSPAGMMGQANAHMQMLKDEAPILAAREKAVGDVLTERAKSQGLIASNKAAYDLFTGKSGEQAPGATTAPTTPQAPTASGTAQGAPATAPAAKPKGAFDDVMSFITGKGGTPYNSLTDYLSAKANRTLSGVAATPETTAIQENLLGNAQSLAGIFPSSRAAGVLNKIAADFQANYGNETPAASYTKIRNQIDALNNAESEFDDPQYRVKIGAGGRVEPAATNQTIQRAKIAVQTSRDTLIRALHQIETLHPGIGGSTPVVGGRFERVQ